MSDDNIIDALDLGEKAYHLAVDEFWCGRKNRREFQGALPKRKHSAWQIIDRIRRKHKVHGLLPDRPTLKIIIAAYDKGLLDRFNELEAEYIKGETDETVAARV